jgi:hypothetical protein
MLVDSGSIESLGLFLKTESTFGCQLGPTQCCGRKSLIMSMFGQTENVGDVFVVPQPHFFNVVPSIISSSGIFITLFGQRLGSIQAASLGYTF